MAMVAGTVTVDSAGIATGSGLAKAIYDADVATMALPAAPTPGDTSGAYSAARPATSTDADLATAGNVRALQDAARRATAWAGALVTYLQANAGAVIPADASGDGLQSGTTHPSVVKTLRIQ